MSNQMLKDLSLLNAQTWLKIGQVAESMNETERAITAYESALRHNPFSEPTLTLIAALCRSLEKYAKAAEYFQRLLKIHGSNGEIWGTLGHCYLMLDELHKAYSAYQQALYHLPNPREPKLWYGIGILYDRYGSFEHAEDAFSAVIEMEPNFEKANEIYFRLGIIYKQENRLENSLDCFKYILSCPPNPLTELDIWFQIGHIYEQKKEYMQAREAYEQVLKESPKHAKVLRQLGWLYYQPNTGFTNYELACSYLSKSLDSEQDDAQTWYLLGRIYMALQKYNEAYNAYQQAVYRDGRNPTFWCSIGVLYYQINQYADALDAYSRAIKLNPYLREVWYNLGTLYESCENQVNDAIDAYTKALELDPHSTTIKQRLAHLKNPNGTGPRQTLQPQQPLPQDMYSSKHPSFGGTSAPANYRLMDPSNSTNSTLPYPSHSTNSYQTQNHSQIAQTANHYQQSQQSNPNNKLINIEPQLNRTGLSRVDNEAKRDRSEFTDDNSRNRRHPSDVPELKRYKQPQ